MKPQIDYWYVRSKFFTSMSSSLIVSLIILAGSVASATDVCGTISSNTTWTTGASPYNLQTGTTGCTVTVNSGVTLTIQAGVQVKGRSNSSLLINGTLSAVGTSGSPIIFTSILGTPAAGDWIGVRFGSGSGPSASQLTYVTVSYTGNSATYPGGIYINGSSPTFTNVTSNFSSKSGVYITGSAATPTFTNATVSNNTLNGINLVSSGGINITNSTISNNTDYAFGADVNTRLTGLTGLTITGNGSGSKNSIGYRGGTITTNETWLAPVIRTITAATTIGSAGILTINAGTTIKFASNTGIDVTGKLIANGTSGNLITFTSSAASPAPGNWNYIKFNSGANPSASQISYATISYAGQNASFPGAIYVTGSSPTFSNLTVSFCSKSGITVSGSTATPSVSNATLTNNSLYGANLVSSGGINLTNSTISNNTDYAIGAEANTRLLGLTGLTLTGNGGGSKNSIGYRGGSINTSETWLPNVQRTVTAVTTIASAGVLTINAGSTVKFAANTGIDVAGKLIANGTSGNLILFTSNSATPAPGNWRAIRFRPGSSALSQVSYATISYGGSSYNADIHIDNCSPTLTNITASYSSGSGIIVTTSGANATISNSILTSNSLYGILISGGAVNLSSTTINNNADYAAYVSYLGQLTGLTGILMSGNAGGTKNSIAYEGRTITGNEILGGVASDLLGGFWIDPTGSLTVSPGATIRLSSGLYIQIQGKLTAIGTASSPILITSKNTTPAPGDWAGILFWPQSNPTSKISYATISYGGGGWGAVMNIDGSSPTLDHVNIFYSSSRSMEITGTASPTLTNCWFANNVQGMINSNPSNTVIANLNYWNSSSGPSEAGSGAGESVSPGVIFNPWLVAAPSDPHYFKSAIISKPIFNPAVGQTTSFDFVTSLSGNWTLRIFDINGTEVRNFSGTGTTGNVVWNGTNGSGQPLPTGGYTFDLDSTSGTYSATKAHGLIIIGQLSVIKTLTANPYYFTPNGDQVNDTTTINGAFNYTQASWTLNIKNNAQVTVLSTSNQGSSMSYIWNGNDSNQVPQPDGVYSVQLIASAEGEQTTSTISVTLDRSGRTTYISSPFPGEILSNVYGWFKDIVGTVTDSNLDHWTLEIGSGQSPSSWTALNSGTTTVSNQTLFSLSVSDYVNGVYSLRLTATHTDQSETSHQIAITIGNFKVEGDKRQINRTLGQSVTITSTIPFTLNETLTIKNGDNQIVKTLFNGQRAAGTYINTWNGLNQQSVQAADDLYFFQAIVPSQQNILTLGETQDESGVIGAYDFIPTQTADPFNNQQMDITYYGSGGAVKTLYFVFATECICDPVYPWICVTPEESCNLPNYCVTHEEYVNGGPYPPYPTIYWSGTTDQGRFIKDHICGWSFIVRPLANWNRILAFGTKPVITNPRVDPPLFGPAIGTQLISFNLSTYQNQTVNVTIEIMNQDSLSKLRTITMNNVSPGNFSVGWDGRANNGMWVAPGHYTIFVNISDSLGNTIESRILTTIQY